MKGLKRFFSSIPQARWHGYQRENEHWYHVTIMLWISFEWLTCYKNPLAAFVARSHISVAALSTRVECDSQSVFGQNELNPLLGQGWLLAPVLKTKLTLKTDKIYFSSYLIGYVFFLSFFFFLSLKHAGNNFRQISTFFHPLELYFMI